MKTVEILGGTAELREKDDINTRQRQLVEAYTVAAASVLEKLPDDADELESFNITDSNLTAVEALSLFDLQSATIVAALASWSFPTPIPTMDTIGDLDQGLYDSLSTATASIGKDIVQGVDFDPPNPQSEEFRSSPTLPSDGSAPVLRADQGQPSTEPQPSATQSTASAELSQD